MTAYKTLSIDVGTSLIKAVVFDDRGKELTIVRRLATVFTTNNGGSEQDMVEVWNAVRSAAKEAVSTTDGPINLVCITAQGDGAWLLDDLGAPLGQAILWNDSRATDEVAEWARTGVLDRAFAINGSLTNLGLPNSILAHLQRSDPSRIDRASQVLTCGSWVFLQMTGVMGVHPSDGSAPWLDVRTGQYSDELLELYGLATLRSLLPEVLSADGVVQPLQPEVANDWGLALGTPVVLAPYDVVSTGVGSGAAIDGTAFCILGTTLCTAVVTSRLQLDGPPSGLTLLTGDPGTYVRAFPTLSGTGLLDWMAQVLGLANAASVTELANSSSPGAGGVRVWPYISPAGERAPFLDPQAQGVIGGLSATTTRADLARGALEGLAHVVRECLGASGSEPDRLYLSGGGSSSTLWCQTLADVTGIPTVRSTDAEVGAKGAAIYAAVATGQFNSIADGVRALVHQGAAFEPNPRLTSLHDERHADFLATRAALTQRWENWPRKEHNGG